MCLEPSPSFPSGLGALSQGLARVTVHPPPLRVDREDPSYPCGPGGGWSNSYQRSQLHPVHFQIALDGSGSKMWITFSSQFPHQSLGIMSPGFRSWINSHPTAISISNCQQATAVAKPDVYPGRVEHLLWLTIASHRRSSQIGNTAHQNSV